MTPARRRPAALAVAVAVPAPAEPVERPSASPGLTAPLAASAPPPVCQACFWQYFEPALKQEVIGVYKRYECRDLQCRAEVAYLLGTLLEEPKRHKPSHRLFFEFPQQVTFGDPRPRFLDAP